MYCCCFTKLNTTTIRVAACFLYTTWSPILPVESGTPVVSKALVVSGTPVVSKALVVSGTPVVSKALVVSGTLGFGGTPVT
jgi:hypothetical protein